MSRQSAPHPELLKQSNTKQIIEDLSFLLHKLLIEQCIYKYEHSSQKHKHPEGFFFNFAQPKCHQPIHYHNKSSLLFHTHNKAQL